MTGPREPQTHLFCLPPGTTVEDWRVVGCHGHGAYGVVYRALRVGQEAAGLVALKVALFPWDPRSMREVALLSLLHHPSVPRLLGHGFRKDAWGAVFPFIVMEWIEGLPLYEWAREQHPSNRRMAQVLAQLAGALQATHASSAVHRDVNGAGKPLGVRACLHRPGTDRRGAIPRAVPRPAQPRRERPVPKPGTRPHQRRLLGGTAHDVDRDLCPERLCLLQGPLLCARSGPPPQSSPHVEPTSPSVGPPSGKREIVSRLEIFEDPVVVRAPAELFTGAGTCRLPVRAHEWREHSEMRRGLLR